MAVLEDSLLERILRHDVEQDRGGMDFVAEGYAIGLW